MANVKIFPSFFPLTLTCLSARLTGTLVVLHNHSDMHAIEFVDDSGCVAQRL